MRANSANLIDQLDDPKEVGLKATFRKTLPVFSSRAVTNNLGLTDTHWIDATVVDGNLWRIANVGNTLAMQTINDIDGAWPAWSVGNALYPNSRPAMDDHYFYFQAPDGNVYRWDILTNQGTYLRNMPGACALVGIGNRCYALWQRNPGAYEIVSMDGQESCHYTIYGLTSMPFVDGVSYGGYEYFYTMDRDAGRVIEIKHAGNAAWGYDTYGVGKPIIPIDAIDEVYGLKLGYASVIDDKVVVTGRLTRTSDDTPIGMDVYAMGPEYFSLGREMYIQGSVDRRGKMLRMGDTLIVSGATYIHTSKATTLFGGDTGHPDLELTTSDFSSIELSEAEGRSTNLNIDIDPDLVHSAIATGSDIELSMAYNGEWCKLATCNLEADRQRTDDQGKARIVSGVGKSAKRLSQWSPDQGIYIPSQAKMYDNPANMTKVIRASGQWESTDPEDEAAPIKLKDLNKLGVLYSTARASRGGAMRGKFIFPSDTYLKPYFGVAINYYRESAAEAAARLGVEVDDLEDNMFGHNGIVAIYGQTEHSGGAGISLNLWKDSVLTKLTSASVTLSANTWYWLQIEFIEGEIRVKYYNPAATTDWTEIIAYMYNSTTLPWKRETLGRGAIVIKNIMPAVNCYGISSEDKTLGVDENSSFPSSGTLLIDNEQITYSGRTGSVSYPGAAIEIGYWPSARMATTGWSGSFLPMLTTPSWDSFGAHSFIGLAAVLRRIKHFSRSTAPLINRTFRVSDWAPNSGNVEMWSPNQGYVPGWTRKISDNSDPLTGGQWINAGPNALFVDEDATAFLAPGYEPFSSTPFPVVEYGILLKPAYYLSTRGVNGTVATSHADGTATLYTTASVQCAIAASFSQDEDQTIEDALKTIVRLAGGEVACRAKLDTVHVFPAAGAYASYSEHKNFVASFELPGLLQGQGAGIAFRTAGGFSVGTNTYPWAASGIYYLEIERINNSYYTSLFDCYGNNQRTLIERVPLRPTSLNGATTTPSPSGTVKVSVQDNLFSVWLNGRYLHTFYDTRYSDASRYNMAFVARQACSIKVHISELDDLLADIVVGTRGNGMSVLSELIADRHIFWRDEPDGSLYFYKTRLYSSGLPDMVSAVTNSRTDSIITRLRAEGAKISEVASAMSLGNSFATINARHANTLEEVRAEANFILYENLLSAHQYQLFMDVHPGIQPGDLTEFREASGTWRGIAVRAQTISIGFTGQQLVSDMQCDCIEAEI
jgi:hypothetical protein